MLSLNTSYKRYELGVNLFAKSKILRIDDVFLNELTREQILPGFYDYWQTHNTGYFMMDVNARIQDQQCSDPFGCCQKHYQYGIYGPAGRYSAPEELQCTAGRELLRINLWKSLNTELHGVIRSALSLIRVYLESFYNTLNSFYAIFKILR